MIAMTAMTALSCHRSTQVDNPASANVAFEGVWCVTNHSDSPVTFREGRYEGALPANPSGDMNGSGKFTTHQIDDSHWELHLRLDVGGETTIFVRRDGDSIWIRDEAYGCETQLLRKQP